MGANFAHDLASGEYTSSLEQALSLHLTNNHYPPVPTSLVPVCIQAIDALNAWEPHTVIRLPEGFGFRGYSSVEAHEVVSSLHLDAWVENDD